MGRFILSEIRADAAACWSGSEQFIHLPLYAPEVIELVVIKTA
jgi:hypothetical protein